MITATSLEKCTAQESVFNAQPSGTYGSAVLASIRVGGFRITSGVARWTHKKNGSSGADIDLRVAGTAIP